MNRTDPNTDPYESGFGQASLTEPELEFLNNLWGLGTEEE